MTAPFYFSHYFSDIVPILNQALQNNLPKDFVTISQELKRELHLPLDQPIIMTAHQPILYYPGIFVKLILASLIANHVNGKAYYLVLDTDKEKIYWKFIFFLKEYYREDILLSDPKKILLNQTLEKKEILLSFIENWEYQLYHVFEPTFVYKIKAFLEAIKEYFQKSKTIKIVEISVFINFYFAKELNLKIEPIYLSQIVSTKAYKWIVELVKSNYKKFYKITNTFLDEFRKENHIKNIAVPFPNLKEQELPFWLSNGYERKTLTLFDDAKEQMILPKALIISLIIRGFLSNLMIHGMGGGFYDIVVERILNEFLSFQISPFITTTATTPFPYKASVVLDFPSERDILHQLRKWKFNPEIYLSDECVLRKQKIFLYNLKNFYDEKYKKYQKKYQLSILEDNRMKERNQTLIKTIEKNPTLYAKILHKEMIKVNHKMHLFNLQTSRILKQKLKISQETSILKRIFLDRTLPIFYYDTIQLYKKYIKFFYKKN